MNKPIIILVNPQLGENIGAAARVMCNFNLYSLRIVSPRDPWPNQQARDVAVHASHIIDKAEIYQTLEEAVADINILYATTARKRYLNKKVITSRNMACDFRKHHDNMFTKTAIIFGPERTGLNNEHLAIADQLVLIPTSSEFSSLNLAQAVAIISYEMFIASSITQSTSSISMDLADQNDILSFFNHLELYLDQKDFFKVADKRAGMINNIRSMFKRITPITKQDIRTLHGIIRALTK